MEHWIDCPECDGNGTVEREIFISQSMNNPYGFPDTESEECRNCAGVGRIEPLEDDE
jgi:DnaJ-class molecular chaperone